MRPRTFTVTREITAAVDEDTAKKSKGKLFGEVDSLLAEESPLDEQEQERVIREFEEIQLRQARTWKTVFGVFSVLLAVVYLHAAWSQHSHPWELRYVGEFQSVVQHGPAIAILLLQALSLAACGLGMLRHVPAKGDRERGCMPAPLQLKLALWGSLLLSACGAVFWGQKWLEMRARFGEAGTKWELAWVPLAPLFFCATCISVAYSFEGTAQELAGLKAMRYQHKKV